MTSIASLPPAVRTYVSDFVARDRRMVLVRAAGLSAAIAAASLPGLCMADRLLALSGWLRESLLTVFAAGAVAPMVQVLWKRLARGIDWVHVAAEIESREPLFGERLETVTSQLLGPDSYRGSQQILEQLLDEVTERVSRRGSGHLVSWRAALRPWVWTATLVLLGLAMRQSAWLNMPLLMQRVLRPWVSLAPVSIAQLDVQPKNPEVLQGESLTIRATIQHLGHHPVSLYLSEDGRTWSRADMARPSSPAIPATLPASMPGNAEPPATTAEFTFTLPGVDRDLHYYIRAADATSDVYTIRVKHVPAVAEFQIRYAYPASTRRPPLTAVNTDGYVEAPVGSIAQVRITATEPLWSAALGTDGEPIALVPAAGQRVWEGSLPVNHDMTCPLELTSAQGVSSSGLSMTIRAEPDRPPLVGLLQPSQDLLLTPRDVVRVRYEAIDDYGIAGLAIRASANGGPAVVEPVHIRSDTVRTEGEFHLDLADLDLGVGDVVGLSVWAEDTDRQTTTTDALRRVLIVPRGIDQESLLRVGELKSAGSLAAEWSQELRDAGKAWGEALAAGPGAGRRQQLLVKAGHATSDAADTASDLRLSLLRAAARNHSPILASALVNLGDAALMIGAAATSPRENELPGRLVAAADRARDLAGWVRTLWQGESATLCVIQRADLRVLDAEAIGKTTPDRRRQAVNQARLAMNAAISELGLNPGAPDIDAQLQQHVEAGRSFATSRRAPDWVAIISEWVGHRDLATGALLAQRLDLAAEVTGLSSCGDSGPAQMAWARDLLAASRVVGVLNAASPLPHEDQRSREARLRNAISQIPVVLDALRREDEALRPPDPSRPRDGAGKSGRSRAAEARAQFSAWAGEPDPASLDAAEALRHIEPMAFDANAELAARNYERCAALDAKLSAAIGQSSHDEGARLARALGLLSNAMAELERLGTLEEKLRIDTEAGGSRPALAIRQRDIAGALARLPRPGAVFGESSSSGDAAREAVFAALANTEDRLASLRQAAIDAEAAGVFAGDATDAVQYAANAVTDALRLAEPDAQEVGDVIEKRLNPAAQALVRSLVKAGETEDADAVRPPARELRAAIDEVEHQLREVRPVIIECYPFAAAKALSLQAAEVLSRNGGDPHVASALQRETIAAMRLAWIEAFEHSASMRLEGAPALAPVFEWPTQGDASSAAVVGNWLRNVTGVRAGRKPGQRGADAPAAPDADPPAYKDAMRAYFDTLAHARDEQGKR